MKRAVKKRIIFKKHDKHNGAPSEEHFKKMAEYFRTMAMVTPDKAIYYQAMAGDMDLLASVWRAAPAEAINR